MDKQGKEHDLQNEMMGEYNNIPKPLEWKDRSYIVVNKEGRNNWQFLSHLNLKSILTKKSWTELLENQQRKE